MEKYPNAFNPFEWTPEELLNHALEETVDLTHYLVGLKELLDAKDKEIERLERLVQAHHEVGQGYHREIVLLRQKKSPFETQEEALRYDMNFNPHFDIDDQN